LRPQIQPHWGNGIAIAVIEVTARSAKRNARRDIKSKVASAMTEEAGNGANASKEPTRSAASVVIDADIKASSKFKEQNGGARATPLLSW
jgi:hypothetical protein